MSTSKEDVFLKMAFTLMVLAQPLRLLAESGNEFVQLDSPLPIDDTCQIWLKLGQWL